MISPSKLSEANFLLRSGEYKAALKLYKKLQQKPNVDFNIELCKKRISSNININNFDTIKGELGITEKKKIRVLFISNTGKKNRPYLDPSVRYRCFNPANALEKKNYVVDIINFSTLKETHAYFYDVFIFHRPPHDDKSKLFIELVKNQHKAIFADYDDLIFNDKYALHSSIFTSGRVDKDKCLDIFKKNTAALKLFNNFIVSTQPLKDKILEVKPNANVSVINNALGDDFTSNLKLYKPTGPKKIYKKMIITYLSGSASHDKDFAIIKKPLIKILKKYKESIELHVIGPLKYDKEIFPDIKHFEFVEYSKLKKIISRSSLNLAPLEINEFTNCKSGLKFFESGAYYVPSIVTPTSDMKRFTDCDGITYASSEDDWYTAIENFIVDREFHLYKSNMTGQYVFSKCTIDKLVGYYEKTIKECLL